MIGLLAFALLLPQDSEKKPINIRPPRVSADPSVKIDYDIVYVRAPRHGDEKQTRWADFSDPTRMEPGADLVLLRPDGTEEVLVGGKDGSVMDPYVSFDGASVYYAKFVDEKHSGADLFKLHVASRKIVKLTDQSFHPNTGAAPWSKDYRTKEPGKTGLSYGVYNLGPCPAPGGKVVFTSNRNAHVPPRGYPKITLQLFVMDEDGSNVEQIGYINIACALHPVILKDGRVLFSTLESQGMHNSILWGVWSIHPDGTNWEPVVSAFATGGAPSGFHFQSQLSDGGIIIEEYYNLNNSGFGTYFRLPPQVPDGASAFGPGDLDDPRNARIKYGGSTFQMPFTPYGMQVLTRFAHGQDGPAMSSIPGERVKARLHGGTSYPQAVGKVTHPSGAPDNHLLTVWSAGPVNHQYDYYPKLDAGLYLIKDGKTTVEEPGQMLLIKNDPNFNEQWPRALVSYKRIYGVDEPRGLVHENDGKRSPHLPEGTPFGLVGTSSLYKRESAPGGKVPKDGVAAQTPRPTDPANKHQSYVFGRKWSLNWALQGSDAGLYENSDIHAIRILLQEPRTDVRGNGKGGAPHYGNHAMERLRILGEIPVRKFVEGGEPADPDGNPDTSFLAKIPADQSFTFQLLDKHGMSLTMAQTWHQVRPGETRVNCGGCHAHSQKPTRFEATFAARPDYKVFDLTKQTPLLAAKAADESGRKWDEKDETGLRFESGVKNVEYFRDVRPILSRSCVPCHTQTAEKPAGGLVLDDDEKGTVSAFGHDAGPDVKVPMAYFRLAAYSRESRREEKYAHDQASRYAWRFQARRSLLVWKLFGRRMDGFPPGPDEKLGSVMPPPEAVAGTFKGPDGKAIKVPPVTDEDRRTIVRWIDLGCPIDLDPRYGWMCDDQRPTLTVSLPKAGSHDPLTRIVVGMTDAYTGLDLSTFDVRADSAVDGVSAGENLADRFKPAGAGIWELRLAAPPRVPGRAKLTVSVKDKQGNVSRVERTFFTRAP